MFEKAIDRQMLRIITLLGDRLPEEMGGFYLAGGTALSLQLGHRKSVDFDFFSENDFNNELIKQKLFPVPENEIKMFADEKNTLKVAVNGIFVSFFHYPYKLLKNTIKWNGIELASVEDIACMKIIAISQRAEKKDFFDLHEIIKSLSPEQIKTLLIEKYGKDRLNCYHLLRSIFFFDDAENTPEPVTLNKTSWNMVKKSLRKTEKSLSKSFLKC